MSIQRYGRMGSALIKAENGDVCLASDVKDFEGDIMDYAQKLRSHRQNNLKLTKRVKSLEAENAALRTDKNRLAESMKETKQELEDVTRNKMISEHGYGAELLRVTAERDALARCLAWLQNNVDSAYTVENIEKAMGAKNDE
jgi:septal ring factor EnvC (AmiA/AmiB activator)